MCVSRSSIRSAKQLLANARLLATLAVLGSPLSGFAQGPAGTRPAAFWVYVGTYTAGRGVDQSCGIYLFELDPASGTASKLKLAGESTNPSFLAIHPSHKFLYAVNEVDEIQGRRGGGVSAFSINTATGTLTRLNEQSSVGSGPCHLSIDKPGKNVLVANYGSGSIACLPIEINGHLRPHSSFIQHEGSGPNAGRQEGPHAHSINLDAAGQFAIVADLGLDRVFIDSFDSAHGKLTPHRPAYVSVMPGSGPRHFAFHPSGRFGYVINEIASTVTAFAYDHEQGTLSEIQTISTIPSDYTGKSYTAEVQVHPSGRLLYGSNRGHNSIAIFVIDETSGKLTPAGFESTQGKTPRNFAIDPTGTYLLAENQDSNTIVLFRIESKTGALSPTGQTVRVAKPVCIRMIPKPNGVSP
jgi:6-phosphogluconolactonase